jgi:hypothetical protein
VNHLNMLIEPVSSRRNEVALRAVISALRIMDIVDMPFDGEMGKRNRLITTNHALE